jgi:hypothetical protein
MLNCPNLGCGKPGNNLYCIHAIILLLLFAEWVSQTLARQCSCIVAYQTTSAALTQNLKGNFTMFSLSNIKPILQKFKTLPPLLLITLMSACTSLSSQQPRVDLPAELGRVSMQQVGHFPPIFRPQFYGRIDKLVNQAGETVFFDGNYSSSDIETFYLDLRPGEYQLKGHCEAIGGGTRGYPTIWMVGSAITIRAGEILTLGCEQFKPAEGQTTYSADQRQLGNHGYSVRLVTLSTKDVENH